VGGVFPGGEGGGSQKENWGAVPWVRFEYEMKLSRKRETGGSTKRGGKEGRENTIRGEKEVKKGNRRKTCRGGWKKVLKGE